MKNRKNILVAFLVIATLCVGIGFAATTTDLLDVDGKLTMTQDDLTNVFDASIAFTDVAVSGTASTGTVTAAVNNADDDLIDVVIPSGVFGEVEQTVILTCSITNTGTQAAKLEFVDDEKVINGNFEMTYSFAETTLAADATTTATITITLKTIPADALIDAAFHVQVKATLVTDTE